MSSSQQSNTAFHPSFGITKKSSTNIPFPDFWILASGDGTYASAAPTLNTNNPPRRDVAMLPGSGYLVIALKADNPGAWL